MSSQADNSQPQPQRQSGTNDPSQDKHSADVGLICVHGGEIRPLLKRLNRVRKYVENGCVYRGGFLEETVRVACVEARTGFARHRNATQTLIREHRPAWVISVGYSSGLSSDLKTGDLVMATEISDTHGNIIPVKCPIPGSRRVHKGRFVVADEHPMTPEAKQKLAESSGAICTDTVSLAAAQICQETGTRFLAIRAILDEAGEGIPQQAAGLMFDANSRAIGTALATLTRGLRQAGILYDWRKRATASSDHLDRFVAGVILRISDQLHR